MVSLVIAEHRAERLVFVSLKVLRKMLCCLSWVVGNKSGSAGGLNSPSVIWSTILNPGHNGLTHHIMNRLSTGMSHSSRCGMCDQNVFNYFLHSAFRQIDAIHWLELWQKCKELQSVGLLEVSVNMLRETDISREWLDTSCHHSGQPGKGSVHFGVVVKRCCSATCLASFILTFTKHLEGKYRTLANLFGWNVCAPNSRLPSTYLLRLF